MWPMQETVQYKASIPIDIQHTFFANVCRLSYFLKTKLKIENTNKYERVFLLLNYTFLAVTPVFNFRNHLLRTKRNEDRRLQI